MSAKFYSILRCTVIANDSFYSTVFWQRPPAVRLRGWGKNVYHVPKWHRLMQQPLVQATHSHNCINFQKMLVLVIYLFLRGDICTVTSTQFITLFYPWNLACAHIQKIFLNMSTNSHYESKNKTFQSFPLDTKRYLQ